MINYTQGSPRRLKKIATELLPTNEDKKTLIYEFYRLLVEPSIMRQKNEKDKINYSQWLIRLDGEDSAFKLDLIKILFVSLQNNRTLNVFLNPPPEDLSELNLFKDDDDTMKMVKNIQVNTNKFYANEEIVQEIEYKRSAAVATDMCSYSTIKTSKHIVQSFYVKSDFPIQMWYNPSNIVLPHSFDHNEWEQYLNNFEIAIKSSNIDDDKHKNTCESIFNEEQVSKEVDSGCIFRWHPHSILFNKDRPKRLAAFVDVDADIPNQPFTQKQIDENAFNIVHNKSFPGYKILNPNFYSTILMPDPKFVFNTTGVRIIHNKITHTSFVNAGQKNRLEDRDEERKPKVSCSTRKQNIVSEVNCTNSERSSTNSSCTSKSTTQQLSCSTTTTQNSDDNVQDSCTDSNSFKKMISDKSENNCQLIQQNNTCPESGCEPLVDSKCVNKSLGNEWCPTISKIDTNVLSSNNRNVCCLDGQSENRLEDSYEEQKPKVNCSTRKQDIISEIDCTKSKRSSTDSTCAASKSTTQQLSCSITTTQKCDDNVQDSCTDSNSFKKMISDKSENNCQLIQQNNTCPENGCEPPVDSKCVNNSLGPEWCQTKPEIGTNNRNVCQSENRGNSKQTKSNNNDDIRSEIRISKYSKTTNANDDQSLDDNSGCCESNVVAGSRPPANRNTCKGPAGLLETTSKRDGRAVVRTEKPSDYRCHDRSIVAGPTCDENWKTAEIVGGYAEFANDRDHCRRTSSEVGLSTRPNDKTADDETADDDDGGNDTSDWSVDNASSSDSLTTLTSDPSGSFGSSADRRWPVFESSTSLSDRSDYTNAGIPCPFDRSHDRENAVREQDDDANEDDYLENVSMPEYTSLDESSCSSDMSWIAESAGDMRRRDSLDNLETDGR